MRVSETLFDVLMSRVAGRGALTVRYPSGVRKSYGDGTEPAVAIRLVGDETPREIALNPLLRFGEAYMDGKLEIEAGRLLDLLTIVMGGIRDNGIGGMVPVLNVWRRLRRRLDQYNPVGRAHKNVAHHYDLDDGLYDLFLDAERHYSCAYFERGDMTLDEAQRAKTLHIARKLNLGDGQRVLDIGCGWGGLALAVGRFADVEVTGITLSRRQLAIAQERARREGLSDRVHFHLQDYRTMVGRFDRIVSVGMFEHVGVSHYRQFFDTVRNLLADDGVALLHSIGRSDPPGTTNPWIAKYIFPGGYIPAISEVVPWIERAGLVLGDMEILRLHYAKTLAAWAARFQARRDRAREIYDERFCRMWEFYLAGSEAAFRVDGLMVFQAQLLGSLDAAPLTRDYMYAGSPGDAVGAARSRDAAAAKRHPTH